MWDFEYYTKIYANQKIEEELSTITENSYFDGWLESTNMQFSQGEKEAYNRTAGLEAKTAISFPLAKLNPQIYYKLSSSYMNTNTEKVQDIAELLFQIPFKIKQNNFSINYSRKGEGINLGIASNNYFDDSQNLIDAQNSKKWIYTALPAIDLFSQKLYKQIQNSPDNSTLYSGTYTFSWKRNLFNNIKDFYLPYSLSIDLNRNIRSGENISDTYQIKTSISNTSLNLFGSKGLYKKYKWYSTDEFTSSINCIVSIPKSSPEDTNFQVSFYNSMLFYINKTDNLLTGIDFLIKTDLDWQARTTLVWQRKVPKLPIEAIINHFYPNFASLERNCTRKETLNITMSRVEKELSTNLYYLHNADIKILKYFTITSGIGGTFNFYQNKSASISLDLTLGAKIEFQ